MGKRRNDKPSKNVFKVAGSQSFKAKNKAKSVTTQLKILNEVNRRKTVVVDQQFNQLQKEVRQQGGKKEEAGKKRRLGKIMEGKLDNKQFVECEQNSGEALKKLNKMSL